MAKNENMKKEIKKPRIAIYQTLGDEQKISVRIEDENVWLTQKLIAELFDVDVRTVNEHLKNIFLEQELAENSVIRNFRITEFSTSSCSKNIFFKCSLTVRTSTSKSSTISFCDSQTLSSLKNTSILISPWGEV